jgi:low affinity Fe/Cu permease
MLVRIFIQNAVAMALLTVCLYAQETVTERAAKLRAQLTEIQAQQTDLAARLAQIDEAMKPENIEHSLAGVGSTRPEELREARRRQLEIQRKGIQSQLDSLAASRTRLESAIAIADTETARQLPQPVLNSVANPQNRTKQTHRRRHRTKRRISR